jgi:YgiT-type zinc finger domain-containing protein
VWADHGIVVVEDIPTQLCPACGEQAWAPDVAVRVERMIAGGDTPAAAGQRLIPVVAFRLDRGDCGIGGQTAAARLQPAPAASDDADATREFQSSDICLCPDCAAATEPAVVRTVLSGAHGWTAVEGIPARVCPACGERFYDEATTWQLVSLTTSAPPAEPATRHVPCRVLSYVP